MYVHIKWIDLLIALYVSCYVLPTTSTARHIYNYSVLFYYRIPGVHVFVSQNNYDTSDSSG